MKHLGISVLVSLLLAPAAAAQCGRWTLKAPGTGCEWADAGQAVAISSDTAVLGAPEARDPGCRGRYGKVLVFRRDATTGAWKQTDVLLRPIPPSGQDRFGGDVAILGGTIVVSESTGSNAWIFEKVAGKWKTTRLALPYRWAARSCGIAKDFIVLGGPGMSNGNEVWVYEKPAGGWTSVASLAPKWKLKVTGCDDVAVSGDRIAVIWTKRSPWGSSVAFFDQLLGSWIPAGTFAVDHPVRYLSGGRIDVHGDLAVLSNMRDDPGTKPVFLIGRSKTGTWSLRHTFQGSEWLYGGSIALSRDPATPGRVLVGSATSGHPGQAGAYVYDPVDPTKLDQWITRKLGYASNSAGSAVALSGHLALVGAPGNINGAYLADIGGPHHDGSFTTYGRSCLGSGGKPPSLVMTGKPEIGGTVTWNLSNARARAPAALLVGAVRQNVPLDAIGMTGCRLLTDPVVQIGLVTDASGALAVKSTIPCDGKSVGGKITSQIAVIDFGAPHPLKVVSTNGAEMTVGGFK